MNWLEVDAFDSSGWHAARAGSRAEHYCSALEKGAILFFPQPPFDLPKPDADFLISLRSAESRFHKNISYRPHGDVLRGTSDRVHRTQLHDVMRRFSSQARQFVSTFLRPYAAGLHMEYASFRPFEEKDRDLPLHKSNALLHVDSFPTRPTGGARILRMFTNINPVRGRDWMVANCFEPMAIDFMKSRPGSSKGRLPILERLKTGLQSLGLPVRARSPYDQFMVEFHHWMKENTAFQKEQRGKQACSFPPFSTWLVYTDGLAHAVVAGQFVLEQTFLVPVESLVEPQVSPVRVFERLLTWPSVSPVGLGRSRRVA
jgi:hypothetical protein